MAYYGYDGREYEDPERERMREAARERRREQREDAINADLGTLASFIDAYIMTRRQDSSAVDAAAYQADLYQRLAVFADRRSAVVATKIK